MLPDTIRSMRFVDGIGVAPQYSRPLWADMHSSMTRAEVSWSLNSHEYDYGGSGELYKPYVFSNLGYDLPLWNGQFSNGKYEFGVTLPFFIDIWMDFFDRSTAPVINTAYRFGAPEFMFYHRLESSFLGIRNYSLRLTPMKHECTHIGDELTIRRKIFELPLTRINVSYNYAELGVTLNDPNGSLKANHSFRGSLMVLHSPQAGWYNIIPEEGDVSLVSPSKMPYEWYLQYQYQSRPLGKTHWQVIASAEYRNRVKYGYPFYWSSDNEDWTKEMSEERMTYIHSEWRSGNFNAMAGFRYCNPKFMKSYKIGLGVRFYNGINPYGQFRSMPFYNQWGFCLNFEQ